VGVLAPAKVQGFQQRFKASHKSLARAPVKKKLLQRKTLRSTTRKMRQRSEIDARFTEVPLKAKNRMKTGPTWARYQWRALPRIHLNAIVYAAL
jgi:hypothetical protein